MKSIFWIALGLLVSVIESLALSTVHLSWTANPEPDVAGYILYYGTNSHGYYAATNVGIATSAKIEDIDECTIYYFALTAVNTLGLQSEFSEEVTNKWKRCVHVELRHATEINGPWTFMYATNLPSEQSMGFCKTIMTPLWPCSISTPKNESNVVPASVESLTNEIPSLPPSPPGITTTNR